MEQLWQTLLRWIKKIDPPVAVVLLGILLISWGFSLKVSRARAVADSLAEATQVVQQAKEELMKAQAEVDSVKVWFEPSYTVDSLAKVQEARQLLGNEQESSALYLLVEAKKQRDWKAVVAKAEEATTMSIQVITLSQEVKAEVQNLSNQREQAKLQFVQTANQLLEISKQLKQSNTRFSSESGLYLTKYTNPLQDNLNAAAKRLAQAEKTMLAAQVLLPEDFSQEQTGDPAMAQREIDAAKADIDFLATQMGQVTAGLDHQVKATKVATPTLQLALTEQMSVTAYLKQLETKRKFAPDKALQKAYQLLADAVSKVDSAQTALHTKVEDKIDFPLAYQAASEARQQFAATGQEADSQVAFADQAKALINNFPQKRAQLVALQSNAGTSYQTLSSLHAVTTWQQQSQNVTLGSTGLAQADGDLKSSQTAYANQEFSLSVENARSAHIRLQTATDLAQALIKRAAQLEQIRGSWTTELVIVQAAINQADSTITQLDWSYDMSGASVHLSSAQVLLTQAVNQTLSKNWEGAISTAKLATAAAYAAHQAALTEKQRADASATAIAVEATRLQQQEYDQATAVAAQATRQQQNDDDSATRTAQIFEDSNSCCDSSTTDNSSWNDSSGDNNSWNDSSSDNNSWNDSSGMGDDNNAWADEW